MFNLFPGLTRASAFFWKEIAEVLRQPRLLATLVLGPFLILLVFGIGYRSNQDGLRTLFVVQPDSEIMAQGIEYYGDSMDSIFIFSGVTPDEDEAIAMLKAGQVDLVVIEPDKALSEVRENRQAVFTIYHRAIDPTQVSRVEYLGWLYMTLINQQVVSSYAARGQEDAGTLQASLREAHQNVADIRQALESGNEALAQQKQRGLEGNVSAIEIASSVGVNLLNGKNSQNGGASVQSTLDDLRENTDALNSNEAGDGERLSNLDKIDQNLTELDSMLAEFQGVDTSVIVSPFRSEAKGVASVQPSMSEFFSPAVLALLLQHLAVTIAALSIVRERNQGVVHLLRVSPLSAVEALFGKYVSYMIFGFAVAAALAALLTFGLNTPMIGSWLDFALVVGVLLFTSLGIGFVISLISQTDSQAVQYSMIVLLASVFFSGFIMSLDMLWEPVRAVSWALPATYGISLLRDISLRGVSPDWMLVGGLAAMGVVLLLIAWRLMHRLISAAQ
jgi:ABC-2 type transport system permease protein